MPALNPLDAGDLRPDVRTLIDAASAAGALSNTVLARMWAHRPELAAAQVALHTRFYDSNVLPPRLLELVRLRIAAINDCRPCSVARKSDEVSEVEIACLSSDDERFSPRERAAIAFAEQFAVNHLEADVADLPNWFSPAEIVELGMFTALMLGSGRLAHVLHAYDE